MWRYVPYDHHGHHLPFPPRASTLTKPKIRSLEAKEAHAHNLKSSPLLKLPAELRNRIYELALGQNKLHVTGYTAFSPDGGFMAFFSSCLCTMHQWNNYGSEHPFHHDICRLEPFVRCLHLGLLRSCSQVYMEAALIPFIHNTFSFSDATLLPRFSTSLIPTQATAITSLTLSNMFAADLLDESYWYDFPELRHLSVTIRGHKGCINGYEYLQDRRRFNEMYISGARRVWQNDPSHEPLKHFNLESFRFRVVCACGLVIRACPTQQDWQQWSEAIEQRVSARQFKRRPERQPNPGRQLLQIRPVNRAVPVRLSLRNHFWRLRRWCVQYVINLKTSLVRRLQLSTRSES